jgi:hypothetical protein
MALVTDIVVQPGVRSHNIGAYLSLASKEDYFFMVGIKECIDGNKNLLATVENPSVNSHNVGEYISGATATDYYKLKALCELFNDKGF